MHPILELGPVVFRSDLAMLLVVAVLGAVLGDRQLRAIGADPALGWQLLPWGAVGGVVGAKLYRMPEALAAIARDPLHAFATLPSTWYGAFAGGLLLCAWRVRRNGTYPLHLFFDLLAPVLAISYALLRIGCFLNGDDYGVPTDAAVGMAFPAGAPPSTAHALRALGVNVAADVPDAQLLTVHPTQLYEAAVHLALFAALWPATRRRFRPWSVFAVFLMVHGVARIVVETVRIKIDRLPNGVTITQLLSAMLVLAGMYLWRRHQRLPVARYVAPPVAR